MRNLKRMWAVVLALVMVFTVAACQPKDQPSDTVLVIGVDANFEEKWNPFLVENAYDHQVVDQIFTPVLLINDKNELEPYGGSIEATEEADGGVLYTVKVNKDMKYSDGKKVTIDDYIYGLYVRGDPSYTGPGALVGGEIEGINEYFYDNPDYSADIEAIEKDAQENYANTVISFEDFLVWGEATGFDGEWPGNAAGAIDYLKGEFTDTDDVLDEDAYNAVVAGVDTSNETEVFNAFGKYMYEVYVSYFDTATWWEYHLKSEYGLKNLEGGVHVPEITGIKKVDDYTCTVKYTRVNIYGDRDLGTRNGSGMLIPKHYYGDYEKGDVSKIMSNMTPMGSGPYKWEGFADNIATLSANVDFFKGVPKTGTVRWQYIPQTDIVDSLASGAIDIANPSGSTSNITEMDRLGVTYHLIDNAGYGYMGMNTENHPLLVRKGIWSVMNRQPSVEGYYGPDLAMVIERPMTTVVSEYPTNATVYYDYDPAKALDYFQQAGYSQVDGKLVDSSGKQLVISVYIGGQGEGLHPGYAMLVQAQSDLAAIGAELQIQDVPFNILEAAMNDGTADMFVLAWSAVDTCDKSSQFRSTGGQNRYRFKDQRMDDMLDGILQTIDLEERRAKVSEMLDYAMENCLELPLYQRKNILAYNTASVNMDTVPTATAFYNYEQVLWQVEMLEG